MESFRKVALLMLIHVSLYLAAEQLAPVQAAVKIDNIEKYVITREGRNDTDLFRVVYDNSKCPLNACGSSTAHMINITQCICSCTPGTPTFLPALGLCGDTKTVKDYLFDSKYMHMQEGLVFWSNAHWCMTVADCRLLLGQNLKSAHISLFVVNFW